MNGDLYDLIANMLLDWFIVSCIFALVIVVGVEINEYRKEKKS